MLDILKNRIKQIPLVSEFLSERDNLRFHLESAIEERDSLHFQLESVVAERDSLRAQFDSVVAEKEKLLNKIFKSELTRSAIYSFEDYLRYKQENQDSIAIINQFENNLVPDTLADFTFSGYCYVCKKHVDFLVDFKYSSESDGVIQPNWRERLVCPGCNLNNRMRAIIHIFDLECQPSLISNIYITEQTTPLYRLLKSSFCNVEGSEYLGDIVSRGDCNDNGIRNEDLTNLSFYNNTFDCIMSFDVFEHIPSYTKALVECYRCLKPDGMLYFSVPFANTSEKNIVRAYHASDTKEIIHLLPPEYHGDPLSSNGCLCFYHFGWQIVDELNDIGFKDARALFYWSQEFGYLGGEQLVFIAKK